MPIRERLLLALATFAACVAVFGGIVGVCWVLERLLGLSEGNAVLATTFIIVFGACFAMTFLQGTPRWFRRDE